MENRLTLPAQPAQLMVLRNWIRDSLAFYGCSNPLIERMVLAIGEGAMNVIQHGFQGGNSDGELSLEIAFDGKELTFRMEDNGPAIDPKTISGRDLEEIRPGGLGTHIIGALMDSVEYQPKSPQQGNCLVMKKRVA